MRLKRERSPERIPEEPFTAPNSFYKLLETGSSLAACQDFLSRELCSRNHRTTLGASLERIRRPQLLKLLACRKLGIVAMTSKGQHVVPRDGKWAVRKTGSVRVTRRYDTKEEAIVAAREIARKQQTDVLIHDRHGQLRERNSYGSY